MSAKAAPAFCNEEFTPVKVQLNPGLLKTIAHLVLDGYSATSHGGLEIGGLLFGQRSSGSVTVEDFRPLACDHSLGPRFILSERDEQGLRDLLNAPAIDPALRGLDAIGWYCSHTRSELLLFERELLLHNTYFSDPVDFVIVFKPRDSRSVTAGIFSRGADRMMHPQRPSTILDLQELSAAARSPNGTAASQEHDLSTFSGPTVPSLNERASISSKVSSAIEACDELLAKSGPVIVSYGTKSNQHIRRAINRKTLVPVLGVVALLSFGGWRYTHVTHSPELLLTLRPGPGNLVLFWKSNVARPQRARVDILDGTSRQHLNITDIFQPSGVLLFPHTSGNVQAVLRIDTANGLVVRRAGFADSSALVKDPLLATKNAEASAATNPPPLNAINHPRRRHPPQARHKKSIPANTNAVPKQLQANQSP